MYIKGIADLKGLHSLNARSRPNTESSRLLQLYQLATTKENVCKRLAWTKGQQAQAEKKLLEIAHSMNAIEARAKQELAAHPRPRYRQATITY